MIKKYATPDAFYNDFPEWKEELIILRAIALKNSKLNELIKWGFPVYTYQNKNVIGVAAFSKYVGIWFYQGALLHDSDGLLLNAQESKTKALRQLRFTKKNEIHEIKIQKLIDEAIKLVDEGKFVKPSRSKPLVIPYELQTQLDNSLQLNKAFELLNLTKKRAFCEYIDSAKRSKTKEQRLLKIKPMIMEGIGLNDKYK